MGLKFSSKHESPQCHTSEEVGSRGDLALLWGLGVLMPTASISPSVWWTSVFFLCFVSLIFFFKTSRMQSLGAAPSARRRTDAVPLVL